MAGKKGQLWVVATPIGNLEDLGERARRLLREADLVLCEDTRHSARLLDPIGARGKRLSLHEHNEEQRLPALLERLAAGQQLALISDAGTPLISDPGFRLVRAARVAGFDVSVVPGPSAVTAALSVCGLPCERFVFEGFLPSRGAARRKRLQELRDEPRTLVFFESPHRVPASLRDMAAVFGAQRPAALVRELSKLHEEVAGGTLQELADRVKESPRGECVIVVTGSPDPAAPDLERVLAALGDALPVAQAAGVAAKITGLPRKQIYARILERRKG